MSLAFRRRTARKFVTAVISATKKTAKFGREESKHTKIKTEAAKDRGAKIAKESSLSLFRKKIRAEQKKDIAKTSICARKQSNIHIFCTNIRFFSTRIFITQKVKLLRYARNDAKTDFRAKIVISATARTNNIADKRRYTI